MRVCEEESERMKRREGEGLKRSEGGGKSG